MLLRASALRTTQECAFKLNVLSMGNVRYAGAGRQAYNSIRQR